MLFVLFFLILGVGWVASNWVKKAGGKAKYKSHCWNCKFPVNSDINEKCEKCKKYYICEKCGKCLCVFMPIKKGGNYIKKKWVPFSIDNLDKSKTHKKKSKKTNQNTDRRICIKCDVNYTTGDNPLCYDCWKKSDFKTNYEARSKQTESIGDRVKIFLLVGVAAGIAAKYIDDRMGSSIDWFVGIIIGVSAFSFIGDFLFFRKKEK